MKKAQQDGYRSRSAYKLLEMQNKYHFIKRNMTIVDLGAAPGGWSQAASSILGTKIFALDILPMEPIHNIEFMQGDFCDDKTLESLLERINGRKVDLVLSDMAPNLSGINAVDQARSMHLVELAFDFAKQVLSDNGIMVVKIFQGEGTDNYIKSVRNSFKQVINHKPKASRGRSRELYLLAKDFISSS